MKFCVVWFNQFFGQNKDSVKECRDLKEVYSFIREIEKLNKACNYKTKFKIIKI